MESDVFPLGLVALCNDGGDPVQPNMISSATATSVPWTIERILLAARFAVFRHDGIVQLIDAAFDSGGAGNRL